MRIRMDVQGRTLGRDGMVFESEKSLFRSISSYDNEQAKSGRKKEHQIRSQRRQKQKSMKPIEHVQPHSGVTGNGQDRHALQGLLSNTPLGVIYGPRRTH